MVRWRVDVEVQPADERRSKPGPRGIRLRLVSEFPGVVTLTRSKWFARRTWPRHATVDRVGDLALLIYDLNDAASGSVVLSDWTGRGDLAGSSEAGSVRRQLLAVRPASSRGLRWRDAIFR